MMRRPDQRSEWFWRLAEPFDDQLVQAASSLHSTGMAGVRTFAFSSVSLSRRPGPCRRPVANVVTDKYHLAAGFLDRGEPVRSLSAKPLWLSPFVHGCDGFVHKVAKFQPRWQPDFGRRDRLDRAGLCGNARPACDVGISRFSQA